MWGEKSILEAMEVIENHTYIVSVNFVLQFFKIVFENFWDHGLLPICFWRPKVPKTSQEYRY